MPAHPMTVLALALPWVHPWAWGPSPQVLAWLVGAACAWVIAARWWLRPACQEQGAELAQAMAQALVLAGVLSALIGLAQFTGLATHAQGDSRWPAFISLPSPGEAQGNLRQPNQLGVQMVLAAVALVWIWSRAGVQAGVQGWWSRACVAGGLLLLSAANVASGSRTGLLLHFAMVAVVVGAWVFSAWRARPSEGLQRLALAGAWSSLTFIVATVLLPLVQASDPGAAAEAHDLATRRLLELSANCSSRLTLWSNVLELVAQRPWLGWGPGRLDEAHFLGVFGLRFCDILDHAHNLPLHIAVEFGVPVALITAVLFIRWVVRAQPWRETRAPRVLAWCLIALILAHSMVEHPLWHAPFALTTGLSLAVLWLTARADRPGLANPAEANRVRARLGKGLALGLTGLAVAYAAFDYHRAAQLYVSPMQRWGPYQVNTLAQARRTWLYEGMVEFADVTTTPVHAGNAASVHLRARELLSYSPEPRVIEKLIDSARLLGLHDDAALYEARFAAAFPQAYAAWRSGR